MNILTALGFPGLSAFQIKANERPIRIYKIVHTGANTQSGGFQDGFLSFVYQPDISEVVNNPVINPRPTLITIDTSIFVFFIMCKMDKQDSVSIVWNCKIFLTELSIRFDFHQNRTS